MAAMTVHPVFAAKPPPFRQENSSGSFVDHFNSSKMFLGQYSNCSNIFFKLADTLHLQNVASHKTLQSMDISIANTLSTQMLNRLEKVAAIVHANNAWASTSTYRVFPRTSAVPEQDKVLTDLAELKDDIQNYYTRRSKGDFEPTIKYENGSPTEAIAIIELYFRKYPTFDVADVRNLKLYQEMSDEVFHTSCARIAPYLIATYPEVPKLQQSDALGMLILIQELHDDRLRYERQSEEAFRHQSQNLRE